MFGELDVACEKNFFFSGFLFTLLFTVVWLASQPIPLKITPQKDSSSSVDITTLLNVVRTANPLNNASQQHSAAMDMMVILLQIVLCKTMSTFYAR